MKFFVSKYATTLNILELDGEMSNDGKYAYFSEYPFAFFKIGRDAFENLEEAVKAAEMQRDRKIKSLEKQIATLRKLTFGVGA